MLKEAMKVVIVISRLSYIHALGLFVEDWVGHDLEDGDITKLIHRLILNGEPRLLSILRDLNKKYGKMS
jgi:hypothetical protein